MKPKFYITTAIVYTNGAPHIGHAYEVIATDALARFKKLDGYEVLFATGADEHGQKIERTASAAGLSPQEFVDKITPQFQAMVADLACGPDDYIRTTEPRHKETAQALWQHMEKNGDIYLHHYSGWYSVRDEAYYNEDEIEERNGQKFAKVTGTLVEWVKESSYFFKLSAYQERLLKFYEEVPDFIAPPERRNEIISFVKAGLRDLSVSRTSFDWGIAVPDAPGHIMYVWVDALSNYLTITGWPKKDQRNGFWPADLHIIGKDIIRFHAVYWPAFLMSAGLACPKRVFAHGFLLSRGTKMSKSLGNVLAPGELVARYGIDPLRYFLLREIPFGQDGNYSHEAIIARINADLANDLGNLAQRSLSMIAKNCHGLVPECGPLSAADQAMLALGDQMLKELRAYHETQALHRALDVIWQVVGEANRYFAAAAPWGLKKTDPEKMQTVLYVTAEILRLVGILIQPYMPSSADKLLDALAIASSQRQFSDLAVRIRSGQPLPAPQPIFPRFLEEEEKII